MTRETLQRLADDLAREIALPADDWQAIVEQAERMQAFVRELDELPLTDVEPASVYRIGP